MRFIPIPHGLQQTISKQALPVYVAIHTYFPAMYPSISKICELTGYCRDTVFKHLKELQEKNVIKRYRRPNRSNVYEINPALLIGKSYNAMKHAIHKLMPWLKKNGSRNKPSSQWGLGVGKNQTLSKQNTYLNSEKYKIEAIGIQKLLSGLIKPIPTT